MSKIAKANTLLGAIIQKVGKQQYSSKGYSNPLSGLKREFIESATKIEEIYVERALAKEPDPTGVDTLARVQQEIKTAYHQENYAKCYTVTISDNEVKEGFTSKNGIQKLGDKKIESLNRGCSVDEYKAMELKIGAISSLEGIKVQSITEPTTVDSVMDLMALVEEDSMNMTFSSTEYSTFEGDTPLDKQVIYTTPKVWAKCKTELARIYGLTIADLKQRVYIVKEFTDPKVKMILADENVLIVHPTLYNNEPQRNAKGMFTNHHLNVAYIMSLSNMFNACVYKTA